MKRIIFFHCRSIIRFLFIFGICIYTSTASAQENYPADPVSDITWSAGYSGVLDIQKAFNSARQAENSQLGLSIPMLTLPSQDEWDMMSNGEKALWLINRERIDRGITPLRGLEDNVTSVAQSYAQYLIDHNAWGDNADGKTPLQRLYSNEAINACHDDLDISENIYGFGTGGTFLPMVVERSVFSWIYNDSGSSWENRHTVLWYPYNDNSGTPGMEGFLGIGMASGPYSSYNFAEIIVMNVFDPCSDWDYVAPQMEMPTVTTASISGIGENGAASGGNITNEGSGPVTARGICWSTLENPNVHHNITSNGSGTGSFTSSITGLSPHTVYYVRAYATNSIGTSYGNQVVFTTSGDSSALTWVTSRAEAVLTALKQGKYILLVAGSDT